MPEAQEYLFSIDYLNSSKIIEFFWFLASFLFFLYALLIRFFLKEDIHPTEERSNQYKAPSQQPHDESHDNVVVEENKQPQMGASGVSITGALGNAISQVSSKAKNELTPVRHFKSIQTFIESYIPLLSVAILCVDQLVSYGFATFCVFAYIISAILFNECQIQSGCSQGCPKGLFLWVKEIWLFALFLNFLIASESQ